MQPATESEKSGAQRTTPRCPQVPAAGDPFRAAGSVPSPRVGTHGFAAWPNARASAGRAAALLLVVLGLVAGILVGGLWQRHRDRRGEAAAVPAQPPVPLAESTRQLLARLPEPVELRLFALFSEETAAPELRNLADRARQLLREFEQAANGRVRLEFATSWSTAHTAAAAEGIQPQNLAAGAPVYLGLVVTSGARKETLRQLHPQWAAALEFDLARAIARVTEAPVPADPSVAAPGAAGVLESVKQQLPDLAELSLEEATRRLRDRALDDFKTTVAEREQALQAVHTRLREADQRGDEAARRLALAEQQQLEAQYHARLSELTGRLQAQLEALQQLKNGKTGQHPDPKDLK